MEYKFRGWDATGQKGWVYGDLVHNIKITKERDLPRVMVGGYEVVPESVGLYSGHHDRNGREIYQGDIIRSSWDLENVVVWDDGASGLYLRHEDFYSTFMDVEFEEMEIIGNAYERGR